MGKFIVLAKESNSYKYESRVIGVYDSKDEAEGVCDRFKREWKENPYERYWEYSFLILPLPDKNTEIKSVDDLLEMQE